MQLSLATEQRVQAEQEVSWWAHPYRSQAQSNPKDAPALLFGAHFAIGLMIRWAIKLIYLAVMHLEGSSGQQHIFFPFHLFSVRSQCCPSESLLDVFTEEPQHLPTAGIASLIEASQYN